ncbi:MAG: tetraacyldisaccharide 4'-kinase [Acidobacteriota bacterium]
MAFDITSIWRQRGPGALLLWPVSCLFGALVALRRLGYRQGWWSATRLAVPVLVVGNRIVGGAGKTPTTIAILAHLQADGWRPGVLTRGYKAEASRHPRPLLLDAGSQADLTAQDTGDEPLLIWRRTAVPVMIDPLRVRGGQALLDRHPEIDILVCDDGLQHLPLRRDIEVIVYDERGQGNGWLLPAGPMREPLTTTPTPGLVAPPIVLYNASAPSTPLRGHCARRSAAPLVALQTWWQGAPSPHSTTPILTPAQQGTEPIWALAGIAQPDRFFTELKAQGWRIHGLPLPDHADLSELPWPLEVAHVFVTEKDAVKLSPDEVRRQRPHTTVWVVSLNFQPEPAFWTALDLALARLPRPAPSND